jgi:hypothetical protein
MNPSTVNTALSQQSSEQASLPQGEDLELKRRLEAFRRTHPYQEIQVAGKA